MLGCDERVVGTVVAAAAATAPAAPDTTMTDRVTLEIKGAKLNVRSVYDKVCVCACGYFPSKTDKAPCTPFWRVGAFMHSYTSIPGTGMHYWVFYKD